MAKALTDHRTHAHAFLAVESPYRRVLAAHAQTDRVEVIADPIAPSLTRLLTRRCIEPSVHHHAQHGD